jgi:tetratricopeptide (TPR) repeat protein
LDIGDYLVAAGIGLLVFFTPFASGGVGVSATGVAEGICFSLAILWSGLLFLGAFGRGGFPNSAWHEFRVLALAGSAFLGLLILQLVPLPPTVIRALSPHAYDLYRNSLPGWPNSVVYADPAYVRAPLHQKAASMVAVLPTTDEVRRGVAVPFAQRNRGDLAQVDAAPVASSAWRSLSVAPVLTRAGLIKCAAMALLFLLVVFYLPGAGDARAERQFRRVMVLVILASGVAVAMGGLSQQAFFRGRGIVGELGTGPGTLRASGPFVNPDHFANYLAMIVPLAVAGALFRVPFEPTRERLSGFQLLCGAAVLILCAAIVISLSRAGWFEVGLGIFVFVYLLHSRHYGLRPGAVAARGQRKSNGPSKGAGPTRWLLLAGGGLLAAALVSLVLVGAGERAQAGARAAESISHGVGFWDRVDMWIDSGGIVRDYPVFGSGFDSWSTVFPHYQRPPWTRFFSGAAQNDYVEITCEVGIVGLVVLGWLGWKIGHYVVIGSHGIPIRHRALFAALVAAISIMGFHEALDFCMQIPANGVLFTLLVALCVRLVRTDSGATQGAPRAVRARMAVPATALALVAVLGLLAVFYQRETVYPDDLRYPISMHDNQAAILSHPASPIPHLWLADRIHNSTGVWLVPELKAAIWLDPTNPAGRDRYVRALLAEGTRKKALQQIAIATYSAPALSEHGYLSNREIAWLTEDELAAAERGLRQASASGFEGGTEGLAQLYSAEGRESRAASVYEAEAQRTPNAARKLELSLAAATSYARAGESRKAERLLLAAVDLGPDDPRPYSDLIGMVYGPERDTESAINTIRMAARNGLGTAPLYLTLEEAAQKAGDAKLAEAALRDAVNADPSFSGLIRLGSFYLERGNFADASEPIRRALAIDPHSAQAYFLLAETEEGEYEYSAAQSDYQRAIALAPDNSEYKDRSIDLLRKIADNAGRSAPGSTAGETQ